MSSSHQPPRPLRILLVEDDECVAGVISSGLISRGHEVTCVATGRDALAAHGYDVLVTDDQLLGDMTGVDLLQALDVRHSGLPTVYISGHPNPEHHVQALRAGAVAYLAKPFGLMDLVLAVESAAEGTLRALEGPTFSREYPAGRELHEQSLRELGAFLMEQGLGPAHRTRILSAVALVLQDSLRRQTRPHTRLAAVVGSHRVEVEIGAAGDPHECTVDEIQPVRPATDGVDPQEEPGTCLERARSLTESLEVRPRAGHEVACLSFELTPVGFDDEELDLSNADYVDPRVVDRLIEVLRTGIGDQAHLVPSTMAATVGRLLALSDTNRTSRTSMRS